MPPKESKLAVMLEKFTKTEKDGEHLLSENEFILQDRITKIKQIIEKYGEDSFYISFSGGKDSTVLSALIDEAIPGNKIPRVWSHTSIGLNMVRDFVFEMAKVDDRIQIIYPKTPIAPMLKKEGYPFKSKKHAHMVDRYQRKGLLPSVMSYLGFGNWGPKQQCPKKLKYQFTDLFKLRVSDKCCVKMKENPLDNWGKAHGKQHALIGTMREEGGRRGNLQCLSFRKKKLYAFQPLAPLSKAWEDWYIEYRGVKICLIYLPPYNFKRTGCKGCPFALHLQEELDTLEKYFPEERKQCELLWEPVYAEYRRIGYRLRPDKQVEGQLQMNFTGQVLSGIK